MKCQHNFKLDKEKKKKQTNKQISEGVTHIYQKKIPFPQKNKKKKKKKNL